MVGNREAREVESEALPVDCHFDDIGIESQIRLSELHRERRKLGLGPRLEPSDERIDAGMTGR